MTPEERAREIAEIRERWKSGTEYVPHGGQCYQDVRSLLGFLVLAIAEEREACAKVAEEHPAAQLSSPRVSTSQLIAAAIRART